MPALSSRPGFTALLLSPAIPTTCAVSTRESTSEPCDRPPLRRLDARCLFEAELGYGDLAHLELLDLAGDGHGELVGRLPVAGDLEVGEALAAEVSELIVGGGVALAGG